MRSTSYKRIQVNWIRLPFQGYNCQTKGLWVGLQFYVKAASHEWSVNLLTVKARHCASLVNMRFDFPNVFLSQPLLAQMKLKMITSHLAPDRTLSKVLPSPARGRVLWHHVVSHHTLASKQPPCPRDPGCRSENLVRSPLGDPAIIKRLSNALCMPWEGFKKPLKTQWRQES